jgi:hypothetical protein
MVSLNQHPGEMNAMRKYLVLITSAMLAASAPAAAAPENWDGLVEVNSPRMDVAFLAPGADFRPFGKVMLDKPEVAFRQNWLRDVNRSMRGTGRVTQADADRILASVASDTTDIFAEEFRRGGYEVVTAPGTDVLRVRTGVLDLVVNAPEAATTGRSRTFTANAGEATIVVEARESLGNGLMARALDRRETRRIAGQANRVTNTADFRALARDWARIAVRKLDDLKAISPVPDPLAPGQRLQ